MNKLLGYRLIVVGLLGLLFFLDYKESVIPVKEFWFVLSSFTIAIRTYFLAKYKLTNPNSRGSGSNRFAEIEEPKDTGDKIRVPLDNAQMKSRSFQHDAINDGLPFRIDMLDALHHSNGNHKTEEIQQAYIIFYKLYAARYLML